MVDPIDRSLLRSNALSAKSGADDSFESLLLEKREKRLTRKPHTDLFDDLNLSDDRKTTFETPTRSFLKKPVVAPSEDLAKVPVSRSRPDSPTASTPKTLEKEKEQPKKSIEETRPVRIPSTENIPVTVTKESTVSHELNKDAVHHRSHESLKDERVRPPTSSKSSEHNVSPRAKSPPPVAVSKPSDVERSNSKQVHYSDAGSTHHSIAKTSPRDNDRLDHRVSEKPLPHTSTIPDHNTNPNWSSRAPPVPYSQEKPDPVKLRPKSSSLWEKIKRREQRERQIRERGLFEHAPPDFVEMYDEPNYGGEREPYVLAQNPKRRTLFYSKKGDDYSYIDVVAEVQKEDGAYVDVLPYDEPEATLGGKYGKTIRSRNTMQYASDDTALDYSDYSTVNNTKELRQVVYDDWLVRKAALVRAEQKQREALKKENARRREEEFNNKLMASKVAFMQWKKDKEGLITKNKSKESEDREKEINTNKKKQDIRTKQKGYIKAWLSERPKSAVDAEKQAIERRRRAKEEKERIEEEEKKKKELSEKAFKKWEEEKKEVTKKQLIEMAKQLKAQKKAEFAKRLERDQLAVNSYEQWLERKEKELSEETKLRRTVSAVGNGSMGRLSSRSDFIEERPPWFPASRTVPRKGVCPR